MADRPAVLETPGNAGRGKGPGFENGMERKQGMTAGQRLAGSMKVRKFQTMLHAKAKEEPDRRFHALADKVWRMDFLNEAWAGVHRNGGSAGTDGERFTDIEAHGAERWLGELSRDLREGTCAPKPVRQALIPKKQPGKLRPLGIPCIRDRVAQTSAMLVLEPIFEADLQPEQYAYRPERSANDAAGRVHSLLNTGHNEVVDCDLSNYFGEIPHAEPVKSVARRVSDGRMLGLVKAWLEMPVNERKTRCLRCPEEPMEFLGYRIGRNYRRNGKGSYIGTRPSKASVQSICRRTGEQTAARYGTMTTEDMVQRLNRMLSGWANYYVLGQAGPACKAVDEHATRRLRRWLCRKHKVKTGEFVRFSNQRLWHDLGLVNLAPKTKSLPLAKA